MWTEVAVLVLSLLTLSLSLALRRLWCWAELLVARIEISEAKLAGARAKADGAGMAMEHPKAETSVEQPTPKVAETSAETSVERPKVAVGQPEDGEALAEEQSEDGEAEQQLAELRPAQKEKDRVRCPGCGVTWKRCGIIGHWRGKGCGLKGRENWRQWLKNALPSSA